jgi:peptide/nickel transport system ATP-binding protein
MYLGSLVEQAPADDIYAEPLHPYTRSLMSAVPVPDPVVEERRERILLAGDLPSPANPPSGCRFHTRCPWRQETRCHDERPQLRVIDGADAGHRVACHWAEDIRSGRLSAHRVEPEAVREDVLAPGAVPDLPGSVTEILGR